MYSYTVPRGNLKRSYAQRQKLRRTLITSKAAASPRAIKMIKLLMIRRSVVPPSCQSCLSGSSPAGESCLSGAALTKVSAEKEVIIQFRVS